MVRKKRVLITGASGLVGSVLYEALGRSCEVSGVDVRQRRGLRGRGADMTKLVAAKRACSGMDFVVDLAADARVETPWTVVHQNNMASTYNVLEASRLAGVRRVVFASSNHVTGMIERQTPYAAIVAGRYEGLDPAGIPHVKASDPIRPDSSYAVGKAFGEAAARYFAEEFGLSVVCLRIGTVNRESRPLSPRHFATLLTHRDLVQLVERCLDAPDDASFDVFYGVSDNTWRFWDIADARAKIGYRPRDDAEAWR